MDSRLRVVSDSECRSRHTQHDPSIPYDIRRSPPLASLCSLTAREVEHTRAGKEGFFRRGKVTMVVHPVVVSDSADELCKRSEEVIKETLHKYDYLVKQ